MTDQTQAPAAPAAPPPAIVKRKTIPHAAEAREASKRAMASLDITTLPMWGGVADKLEIAREQHGIHTMVLNLCAFPIEHVALLATKLQAIGYRCYGPPHGFVIDWTEQEEKEETVQSNVWTPGSTHPPARPAEPYDPQA